MSLQYDRIVRVHIAGVLVEDLRIDGEIEMTADAQQSTGELTIYNLKRSSFEVIRKKGERVVIEAGYKGTGAQRLFEGVAQRIWKTRGETSFQTRIQLGDGLHSSSTKGGNTEHTFAGTVPTREIASKLAADMGLEVGPLDAIPADDVRTDFRASGKTSESMQRLVAETEGLGWMERDGVARFTSGAHSQPDGVRIIATSKTGLIGIPELEEDGRMSCTLLLDPRAKVGGEILIEGSEFIEPSPYTIVGIQHIFSNWTGRFLTMVDAVPPDYMPNAPELPPIPLPEETEDDA